MIFSILTIIAVWIFPVPLPWQVTLTVFASIHILILLGKWGGLLGKDKN